MEQKYTLWHKWSDLLQRWGLHEVIASILEASAPLHLVAAQLMYISQPLAQIIVNPSELQALADTLEDLSETRIFVAMLRKDKTA